MTSMQLKKAVIFFNAHVAVKPTLYLKSVIDPKKFLVILPVHVWATCIVFISFYAAGPTSQQDEVNPLF